MPSSGHSFTIADSSRRRACTSRGYVRTFQRVAGPTATPDTVAALADALREDFGRGLSDHAAEALTRARAAGLPWPVVTKAVADGLAQHHATRSLPLARPTAKPAAGWSVPRVLLVGVLAYTLLRPVLGLGHELAVLGLAWGLRLVVETGFWQPLIDLLRLDPIYAGAAIRAAGGVQVAGLAVGGPLGVALHSLIPAIFLNPEQLAPGAGVSMVAAPGAPALGRGLAAFGADVLWLVIGLWLAWGWRQRKSLLVCLGFLIQAQIVVNHLLDTEISLPDLEASGVPFALALALPSNQAWVSDGLRQLPTDARATIMGAALAVLGYVCALLVVAIASGVRRLVRRRPRPAAGRLLRREPRLVLVGAAIAVVTAVSPIGALAVGESNWTAPVGPVVDPAAHAGRLRDRLRAQSSLGPTAVSIELTSDGGWRYLVAGQLDVIRGVGYNPQYASLSPGERAHLYQRDFSAMRQLGINTIEGWYETQFDQLTLDAAALNGIGVLMPFELNQDWNYADPAVQASILDRVSAYVERYKNHPAVRMWAPGNEDLHRILYPHWVSAENDPVARTRADAFAAFLPVLVDHIHALDPDHPVMYRDAEDLYLPRLKAALLATGIERPWLVYGANAYGLARMRQIVDRWPEQWVGGPLVLSEFAPGGVGPAERPLGFQQDWQVIRSRPGVVLGGLAYTWATNGPEELDRIFGLVDASGVPADGALAALSASYLADLERVASSGAPGG